MTEEEQRQVQNIINARTKLLTEKVAQQDEYITSLNERLASTTNPKSQNIRSRIKSCYRLSRRISLCLKHSRQFSLKRNRIISSRFYVNTSTLTRSSRARKKLLTRYYPDVMCSVQCPTVTEKVFASGSLPC